MKNKIYSLIAIALTMATVTWVSAQGDAELSLNTTTTEATKDQEINVDIQLKNPQSQAIISVRSWIEYDNTLLEAVSIDTQGTPFNLAAPGEDEISASEGKVKIGRSNISGGAKATETKVATVKFKVITPNAATAKIEFYDYQVSELGHTSVNIIDGGFPLNILAEEPEPLEIKLNPGATPAGGSNNNIPTAPTEPVITNPTPPTNIGGNPVVLLRPEQLKANTGPGFIDLQWMTPVDPNRVGFNIYYGKTSGQYSRRRTISNANAYRLDNLNNGETYYLAITAYDAANRESDYSNEVGIIVNQPLSSTHPFEGLLQKTYQNIPSQPQNGPLVGWLAFSAMGLGGSIVYRKK